MKKTYNVAVMGATGAVGTCFLNILAERKFPIKKLYGSWKKLFRATL